MISTIRLQFEIALFNKWAQPSSINDSLLFNGPFHPAFTLVLF